MPTGLAYFYPAKGDPRMILRLCRIALGSLLLIASSPACVHAADFYVDNVNGSDTNDASSPDQARKTIAPVLKQLKPGDTLHLAANDVPYYEEIRPSRSGTAEAPVIIDGHGAVVSGTRPLPGGIWTKQPDGHWSADLSQWVDPKTDKPYHQRFERLYDGEITLPGVKTLGELKPASAFAEGATYHIRLAEDADPNDAKLELIFARNVINLRDGVSHVTFRNLVAERALNDCWNVHGSGKALRFENITGRYGGMIERTPGITGMSCQGFTVHGTCETTVVNGYFHDNPDGIVDINSCKTTYINCLIENNPSTGVNLFGAEHKLIDCVLTNNATVEAKPEKRFSLRIASQAKDHYGAGTVQAEVKNCALVGSKHTGLLIDLSEAGGTCELNGVLVGRYGIALDVRGQGITGKDNVLSTGTIRMDGMDVTIDALSQSGLTGTSRELPKADALTTRLEEIRKEVGPKVENAPSGP